MRSAICASSHAATGNATAMKNQRRMLVIYPSLIRLLATVYPGGASGNDPRNVAS
jgi:hypothetical protein